MLGAGVYFAWTVASGYVFLLGLLMRRRFRAGHWKSMRVIEPAPLPRRRRRWSVREMLVATPVPGGTSVRRAPLVRRRSRGRGRGAASAEHRLLPERFAVNAPVRHLLFGGIDAPDAAILDGRLHGPRGSRLVRFAEDVKNARFLRFTPAGDLLVTQPREGRVLLLERDRDGDGRSDGRRVRARGPEPAARHGLPRRLALRRGDRRDRPRALRPVDADEPRATFERVVTGLPGGGNHWTRTVRFGPDGWMYVSIGSSCNVCVEKDQRGRRSCATGPTAAGEEIFATGLRNSVGFDWQPGTTASSTRPTTAATSSATTSRPAS